MRRAFYSLGLVSMIGIGLSGCATSPQSNAQLDQARARVSTASQDPVVARQAPLELQRAREALRRAESSWEEDADPEVVSHEAYLASQQAAIAQQVADTRQTQEEIKQAEAERSRVLLSARTGEVEQLQRELSQVQARQTPRGTVLTLSNVLFRTGSSQLIPGAAPELDRLATFLRNHPQYTVEVEGHTDSTGSDAHNFELSERRAQAVRGALVTRGVDPNRIVSRGYGASIPVASNDTSQGRQLNRRVEVVLSGGGQPPQASGAPTSGAPTMGVPTPGAPR